MGAQARARPAAAGALPAIPDRRSAPPTPCHYRLLPVIAWAPEIPRQHWCTAILAVRRCSRAHATQCSREAHEATADEDFPRSFSAVGAVRSGGCPPVVSPHDIPRQCWRTAARNAAARFARGSHGKQPAADQGLHHALQLPSRLRMHPMQSA